MPKKSRSSTRSSTRSPTPTAAPKLIEPPKQEWIFIAPGLRTRAAYNVWHCDPEGKHWDRRNMAAGQRTPNGFVWAEDLEDFYWVKRIPKINALHGLVSRTMLDAMGENYMGANGEPDPHARGPRRVEPWPLLKVGEVQATPDFGWIGGRSLQEKLDEWVGGAPPPTEETVEEARDRAESPEPEDEVKVTKRDTKGKGKERAEGEDANEDEDAEPSPAVDPHASDIPVAPSKEQDVGKPEFKEHIPVKRYADIPKLEEFIPTQYFPDILLVQSERFLTEGWSPRSDLSPVVIARYKRVLPVLPGDAAYADKPRIAHLTIDRKAEMGRGNHSHVYRAPLALPPPLSTSHPSGKCIVAAKLAMPRAGHRAMLVNEAKTYDEMPRHMQEEWSGYNLIKPIKYPVPVGPVAPKFFGLYAPENDLDSASEAARKPKDWGARLTGRSPILLVEECGQPIELDQLNHDTRSECYSLFRRLFETGIMQGSAYVRNILVQPGPLTVPLSHRSFSEPRYRVIDYGRAETEWEMLKKQSPKLSRRQKQDEVDKVQSSHYRLAEMLLRKELGYDRREGGSEDL